MDNQGDRDNKKAYKARISSSNGWSFIEFLFNRTTISSGEIIVYSSLVTSGQFWDREKLETNLDRSDLETVEDFRVSAFQVGIPLDKLRHLRDLLSQWLNKPFEFKSTLREEGGQEIAISVGRRDFLISRIDRPVFTLSCSLGKQMITEINFVVDHSCVNLFYEDLDSYLRASLKIDPC